MEGRRNFEHPLQNSAYATATEYQKLPDLRLTEAEPKRNNQIEIIRKMDDPQQLCLDSVSLKSSSLFSTEIVTVDVSEGPLRSRYEYFLKINVE